MLNALAAPGSHSAHGVFSRLRWTSGTLDTVRYAGTSRAAAGSIRLTSIMPSTTLPSTGRSLDSAYAALTSTTSCTSQPPMAYSTVLRKKCAICSRVHASAYVCGCGAFGTRLGRGWASSGADFSAPVTRSEEHTSELQSPVH